MGRVLPKRPFADQGQSSDMSCLPALQAMKQLEAATEQGVIVVTDKVSLRLLCQGDIIVRSPQLAAWRNAEPRRFFTEFKATAEATTEWLRTHYLPSDELMFVITEGSQAVGHLGLSAFNPGAHTCELGRVLRGAPTTTPGLMTLSTQALLRWAQESLSVCAVSLEVFYDNAQAMRLYERCGFKLSELVLFVGEQQGFRYTWRPLRPGQEAGERPSKTVARLVCNLGN